jgi:hypothetical protein
LAELFAREVLAMLVRKELLNPDWVKRILSWSHTGFNVHSLVRTQTKIEAERVGKYMIRPLLSLERLSFLEPEGKVGYRHGQGTAEQETMDYLEFIARVTSHIPDKGQVMVRYFGLCKALHKSNYAEFNIMLSHRDMLLIFIQLHFVVLSIITSSPGRIKWNHPVDTGRFSKTGLGAF